MDLKDTHEDWESEAPFLAKLGRQNPFTVPENYFSELPDRIESAISTQNIREAVSQTDGFTIPENYFTTLSQKINQRITEEQPVQKTGRIRLLQQSWLKYGVAACLTAILGLSAILTTRNNSNSLEAQFSKVPENEIITYLQLYSDRGDTPVIIENLGPNAQILSIDNDISQDEIEEYIEAVSL